ncbi:MAG: class I SAM-dependent methyltransferase [Verrucomicrobia bacterium]|nr:class I SAM-dependent methyltransferase [Verrucomicrobiota bacterium]
MGDKNLATKLIDKARQFAEATPDERIAAIRDLPRLMLQMAKAAVAPPSEDREDPRVAELLGHALVWGTRKQAKLLGAEARPTDWAYRWVIGQLRVIRFLNGGDSLVDKVLVDLGAGRWNPVMVEYADKVRHAWLVDRVEPGTSFGRGTFLRADLEAPLPLPSGGADIVVCVNTLEHLSGEGRLDLMREIERVLAPGGRALITMSYLFDLDDNALSVLSKDPTLAEQGNSITSRVDAAALLAAAPRLRLLGESDRSLLPGFEGFDERAVRGISGLLTERLADSEWATLAPQTNALGLSWAVLGMALEKPAVGDIEAACALRGRAAAPCGVSQARRRFEQVLTACPTLEGKRVLVLNDDAGELSGAIEHAGAKVQSCVANMEGYAAVKARYPDRTCWVHDLEQPWNLRVGDRYDLVVVFDVLHRLADPEPLIAYMTQLAPQIVLDTIVLDSEREEIMLFEPGASVRCAPSPSWIKERFERLDVDVHDVSGAVEDGPDGCYTWVPQGTGAHDKDGHPLRRFYLCRRRRDALSPLLVHVHMQKTGGQSVNAFLGKHSWYRMIHYYKDNPMVARWDVFHRLVNEKPEPLIFTSHVTRFSFPPLLGGRLALYFAIFRHPYDTIFSYIKYIKKNYALQVPSLRKILPGNIQEMPIEDIMKWYMRNPTPFHFTGHVLPVFFLTQTGDIERAKEIAERFFFVGITEEMPRSMEVLQRKLHPYGFHFPEVPWEKKNMTSDVKLAGYDVRTDQEFLDYAAKHLGHELAFYEWARERFEREATRFGVVGEEPDAR